MYEYTSLLAEFELTTLLVIETDCTGSCKSNYHTITTTTVPAVSSSNYYFNNIWYCSIAEPPSPRQQSLWIRPWFYFKVYMHGSKMWLQCAGHRIIKISRSSCVLVLHDCATRTLHLPDMTLLVGKPLLARENLGPTIHNWQLSHNTHLHNFNGDIHRYIIYM